MLQTWSFLCHMNPLINWQTILSMVPFRPFQFPQSCTSSEHLCGQRSSSQWLNVTGIWWVGIHGSLKQSMMKRTEFATKKIIAPKFNNWEIRKRCSKGLWPGSLSVPVESFPKFPSMCQTHSTHYFRVHNHSFHNIFLGCCVYQVIPVSYSGAFTVLRERLGSWAEQWSFLKETSSTLLVS